LELDAALQLESVDARILTSVIRQIADAGAADCRNSSAEANTQGVCPAEATRLSIDSRTLKSSSTAATMCFAAPAFELESPTTIRS
jgi:hypothetical protein